MDLKQLTALITVAEVRSVTKAAALLHVVQPAVTRQIRMLEEEMGVPLFHRTRQGMIPTAEGGVFVEHARRALRELERARAEIRPDSEEVGGIVTIGLLESAIDLVMEPLVGSVSMRHPGIELRIVTAYSGHLQQWLDSGDLDLSLLYNLADTPSMAVLPLLEERLWAVAPPGEGLAPDRPIPFDSVLAHTLVMPTPGHGLRALIDKARASTETRPQVAIQTNSMYMQKKLVIAGRGWTILPACGVAREIAEGVLEGAPLCDPVVSRSVVLGRQRGQRTVTAVEVVARELICLINSLVAGQTWPSAGLAKDDG